MIKHLASDPLHTPSQVEFLSFCRAASGSPGIVTGEIWNPLFHDFTLGCSRFQLLLKKKVSGIRANMVR